MSRGEEENRAARTSDLRKALIEFTQQAWKPPVVDILRSLESFDHSLLLSNDKFTRKLAAFVTSFLLNQLHTAILSRAANHHERMKSCAGPFVRVDQLIYISFDCQIDTSSSTRYKFSSLSKQEGLFMNYVTERNHGKTPLILGVCFLRVLEILTNHRLVDCLPDPKESIVFVDTKQSQLDLHSLKIDFVHTNIDQWQTHYSSLPESPDLPLLHRLLAVFKSIQPQISAIPLEKVADSLSIDMNKHIKFKEKSAKKVRISCKENSSPNNSKSPTVIRFSESNATEPESDRTASPTTLSCYSQNTFKQSVNETKHRGRNSSFRLRNMQQSVAEKSVLNSSLPSRKLTNSNQQREPSVSPKTRAHKPFIRLNLLTAQQRLGLLNSSESNSTSPEQLVKRSVWELDHAPTRLRQKLPRSGPLDCPPRTPHLGTDVTNANQHGQSLDFRSTTDKHRGMFFFKKKP